MKTNIYTFYDKIAQQCEGLRHARNHADAIRSFNRSFKEREDAEDFALLYLGVMDHDTGNCEMEDVPEQIPTNTAEYETRETIRRADREEKMKNQDNGG